MGASATQPQKRLGAWLVRVGATVYQADTDGFVVASGDNDAQVVGLTDSINPPTTEVAKDYGTAGGDMGSITFPVKKNDYWEVTGIDTVFWIPLEP